MGGAFMFIIESAKGSGQSGTLLRCVNQAVLDSVVWVHAHYNISLKSFPLFSVKHTRRSPNMPHSSPRWWLPAELWAQSSSAFIFGSSMYWRPSAGGSWSCYITCACEYLTTSSVSPLLSVVPSVSLFEADLLKTICNPPCIRNTVVYLPDQIGIYSHLLPPISGVQGEDLNMLIRNPVVISTHSVGV